MAAQVQLKDRDSNEPIYPITTIGSVNGLNETLANVSKIYKYDVMYLDEATIADKSGQNYLTTIEIIQHLLDGHTVEVKYVAGIDRETETPYPKLMIEDIGVSITDKRLIIYNTDILHTDSGSLIRIYRYYIKFRYKKGIIGFLDPFSLEQQFDKLINIDDDYIYLDNSKYQIPFVIVPSENEGTTLQVVSKINVDKFIKAFDNNTLSFKYENDLGNSILLTPFSLTKLHNENDITTYQVGVISSDVAILMFTLELNSSQKVVYMSFDPI